MTEIKSKEWQPYVGDQGGTGWTDGENVVYQDDPPGELDISGMDVEDMGEFLSAGLSDYNAEKIFDQAGSRESIEDAVEIVADSNKKLLSDINPDGDYEEFYIPEVGSIEVEGTVGDPANMYGDNAGYFDLEGEYVASLGGEDHEGVPDDAEVLSLSDTYRVQQIDDYTPNAVDMEDMEYDSFMGSISNHASTDSDTNAPRMDDATYDKFWGKLKEVHEQEAENMQDVMQDAKKSSYSPDGRLREMAFLEAASRKDLEVRNGQLDDGREPDEAMVGIAEKMTEASQQAFEQEYGESKDLYRGISNTAFEGMIKEAIAEGGDSVTLETFGMTNYATEESVGEKFAQVRGTANIVRETDSDEVLSWTDYMVRAMNEGEIAIEGDAAEISLDQIQLPWAESTLEEELDDPSPAFLAKLEEFGMREEFEEGQ